MIEISEAKYWKELNYPDGVLYCQLLNIDGKNDWRMIAEEEENDFYDIQESLVELWYHDDDLYYDEYDIITKKYLVVPVRDL